MRYDVALAACKSYEDAEVSAALETAVTAAGGLDWVTPGMRVADRKSTRLNSSHRL